MTFVKYIQRHVQADSVADVLYAMHFVQNITFPLSEPFCRGTRMRGCGNPDNRHSSVHVICYSVLRMMLASPARSSRTLSAPDIDYAEGRSGGFGGTTGAKGRETSWAGDKPTDSK